LRQDRWRLSVTRFCRFAQIDRRTRHVATCREKRCPHHTWIVDSTELDQVLVVLKPRNFSGQLFLSQMHEKAGLLDKLSNRPWHFACHDLSETPRQFGAADITISSRQDLYLNSRDD
jgi:hypothetical protein